MLEGSPFLYRLDKKNTHFWEDYHFLASEIPEIAKWSYDQYIDAMLLSGSRNFGVKINSEPTNVMVPLSDMFNHKKPFAAPWTYDDERKGFKMTAGVDINKDQEINDSYGDKSSHDFLLHYGFVYENDDGENPADEIPLWLDLDYEDPLYYNNKREFFKFEPHNDDGIHFDAFTRLEFTLV